MNILHAAEINRRYRGVRAVSVHPGVVATGFAREGNRLVRILYETVVSRLFMITPEEGADTLVWLATTEDWTPGEFYVKRKIGKTTAQAQDAANAKRLWEWSERAV